MDRSIVATAIAASLLWTGAVLARPEGPKPDPKKTTICHVPPGNPARQQTITVANSSVRGHLSHHPGDSAGACAAAVCGNGLCEGDLGETPATCVPDCACDCSAVVDSAGIAVDLGTVLGVGTATLTAGVCAACNAEASSIAFSFAPSLDGTPFVFTAGAVGAPRCELLGGDGDEQGTVGVSGQGTFAANGSQGSTNFTLTLVKVGGLVCSGILTLDPATLLGVSSLTVPISIPCGDATFETCSTR